MQVEFDPQQVSYAELLNIFWAAHNPLYNSSVRQYRNAVFYLNDAQRQLAEQSRAALEAALGSAIKTDIEPVTRFYPAEDYHQKYYLRNNAVLFAEFRSLYPDPQQFVASTAAARVNGYLGCNGSPAQLQDELDQLGLSIAARQLLVDKISGKCLKFTGFTCPAPGKSAP